MATKKTPAKAVVKKVASKKVAPASKKAAPVKKAAAKAPAKKVVAKPVAKKAAPAPKKATPVKKAAAKAPAKKVVAKPIAKKAAPAPKKAAPVKKAVVKAPAKKVVAKPVAKKAAPAPKKEKAPKSVAAKVKKEKVVKPVILKKAPVKAKPIIKVEEKQVSVKNPVKAPIAKPEIKKPIALPKIASKESRKYEPDFTKSVLDKKATVHSEEIVKYSDADLAEFKELIQRKLGSAKKELAYLQGLLTRKDDMGGDDGDGRYMTMEDGSLSMEREQLSQMASRQITFVDHLEKALMRIENKTYGVCRVTGKLIDKARLRAVPHATLSIEAKMSGNK
jgi:RNA polymerase-binding transcription factor DksA